MSEKDTKCVVCQKQYTTVSNLRQHLRKYHSEDADRIIQKKTYNYRCEQCNKNFSYLKHYNYHKKTHKNQCRPCDVSSASKHTNAECPICKLSFLKEQLIFHFEEKHDIKCDIETFEFTSFEEFTSWKTKMEHDTKSKYVLSRGFQSNKNGIKKIKYNCHRSGKYVAKGKGIRHLKSQGSNKIGSFCPAHLNVVVDKNNMCKVSLIKQHVGHDNDDLEHLFLTFEERKSLANKMAQKIPLTQILDDVRDSVDSQLERIHLLSKKDLHNIKKSFQLQSTARRQNDDVSVDICVKERESSDGDLLISEDPNVAKVSGNMTAVASGEVGPQDVDPMRLAIEKQKLIDNFAKQIENVTCMEQVNAVKKLHISLGQTLKTIATKQGKLCIPSASLNPHNKNITPQRGKLHLIRKKISNAAASVVPPTNKEMQESAIKLLSN